MNVWHDIYRRLLRDPDAIRLLSDDRAQEAVLRRHAARHGRAFVVLYARRE